LEILEQIRSNPRVNEFIKVQLLKF
jgi:hypothetical protein